MAWIRWFLVIGAAGLIVWVSPTFLLENRSFAYEHFVLSSMGDLVHFVFATTGIVCCVGLSAGHARWVMRRSFGDIAFVTIVNAILVAAGFFVGGWVGERLSACSVQQDWLWKGNAIFFPVTAIVMTTLGNRLGRITWLSDLQSMLAEN